METTFTEPELHILVVTPNEGEFEKINATLGYAGQYVCHWRSRLGGVDKLAASGDYHLVLLQYHWHYKNSQMLLHRLGNEANALPVVVFTEFLERDLDQHIISSGADDYFALETVSQEQLDRTLRYAVIRHGHEQRLSRLAYYDSLCGVANRQLFADRLQHAISLHKRNYSRFALLYIDLDHFKRVNDQYGHAAGDETLAACANVLRDCLRESDSLARLAGDEFVVLADSIDSEQGLAALATKIIASLNKPLVLSNGSVQVGCSVGIAVFPDVGDEAELLMRRADNALYQAKARGGGTYVFYQANTQASAKRDELTQVDILRAVKREEICVRYQPRVDLATGRIVAVEALMRWSHPARGMLSPTAFFELAESNGLLPTLSYWVLKEAIGQWAQFNQELDQRIGLAVNVTGPMLREVKLVDRLRQAVHESNLSNLAGLELEVCQSDWLKYASCLAGLGLALQPLAVHFSMDNVGQGFLPMGDLNQDLVKTVVISRDLIGEAEESPAAARTVQAIAAVGSVMGKTTIAQGVENLQQMRQLESYGCTCVQGYFTSSPLTLAELRTRLLQQKMGRLTMLS
ncbi:putative bifunctional diguanylate cyclase/phosphodiesterase [Halioxenophilus aromaticivorans]